MWQWPDCPLSPTTPCRFTHKACDGEEWLSPWQDPDSPKGQASGHACGVTTSLSSCCRDVSTITNWGLESWAEINQLFLSGFCQQPGTGQGSGLKGESEQSVSISLSLMLDCGGHAASALLPCVSCHNGWTAFLNCEPKQSLPSLSCYFFQVFYHGHKKSSWFKALTDAIAFGVNA